MKRILFACIIAAATSAAFAQTATVSKTDFISQTNQLNTYITGNQTAQAQTKWAQLDGEMKTFLNATTHNLDVAKAAGNATDIAHYTDVMQHQMQAYNDAGQFFRGDMVQFKLQLKGALTNFSNTL
jgi:hypothetical protein